MGTLYVWADGSGTVSDSHAGAGIAWTTSIAPKEPEELLAGWGFPLGQGTNNHAELSALKLGLMEVAGRLDAATPRVLFAPPSVPPTWFEDIVVLSDSEYALGMMTQPWKAKVNGLVVAELREVYERLRRQIPMKIQHCKGHVGTVGNELADLLAGEASRRQHALTLEGLPETLGLTPELLHVRIKLRRPTTIARTQDPGPSFYPRGGPTRPLPPVGVSYTLAERRAFQDGTAAKAVGIPREACPYNNAEPRTPVYLKHWTAWLKGWDAPPGPPLPPPGNVPSPSESS